MPTISIDQAFQLAAQYHRDGNLAAAEAMCRQILAVMPSHRHALLMLGLSAISAGRYEEARECFSALVAQYPFSADHRCDLGVIYRFLDQPDEAVRCFEKALEIDPLHSSTLNNLSDTLLRNGRVDEAIAYGRRAVAARPDFAEAHSNLGNALRDKGQLAEAIEHFTRALEINPTIVEAHNNLAYAYIEKDRWDEAIASGERALALRPGYAKAWLNRGTAFLGKGDPAQAEQAFRRAIACGQDYTDAHWNLSVALLTQAQYDEGWREFEWRLRSSMRPILGGLRRDLESPPWNGAPVEGSTLIVFSEQGLGDTIQFARYLPLLRDEARARRVIFLCPPPLESLFQQARAEWDIEIVSPREGREPSSLEFDHYIALLSLPLALRRFEPLPAAPYLRADPEKRTTWRERLGSSPRLKVGLAWKGNPQHANDRHRSLDPRLLAPLLQLPDVDWYSLQVAPASGQSLSDLPTGIRDLTTHITDFADTAALMEELDLVLSVDTATAHLAGALGRPVWTLLPFASDWRWGLACESTPWYATMRLFRQKTTGAWEEVIQRVAGELSQFRGG